MNTANLGWKGLAAACALVLSSCTTPPTQPVSRYRATEWSALPGWPGDALTASYRAWHAGCAKIRNNASWQEACRMAPPVESSPQLLRDFIESHFLPLKLRNSNGTETGLITGYYEPVYSGSLTRTEHTPFPVYARPKDLITVELDSLYPELKGKRVRGKLVGHKLLPYPSRAEIASKGLHAPVLAWLANPLDVQFLQIQGSGRVRLPDGKELRLGYADQNGHPYRPVGRWLVEQGEMPAPDVSMQSIRSWAAAHPERVETLLDSNPSYVFFRMLPASQDGPPGSLGQPLTAGHSIAVDPATIPLGSLVYLSSTRPDTGTPIQRLVAAQDTGGAIRGAVRADFFWGTGSEAGELAGRMKQTGELWLLWPKAAPLPPQTLQE